MEAADEATCRLEALELLAGRLGIEVVEEDLIDPAAAFAGGLCRVRGRVRFVRVRGAPPAAQAVALGRALLGYDLEKVYLTPALRAWLESLRS